MKGFTFYLISKKLYEIETQMSLTAKLKAFLRAASFLNLHCTVPDTGNLLPRLVILFKWRAFDVCRVDCLKSWVGQEESPLGFAITSYGKTRTNFGPTQSQGQCGLRAGPINSALQQTLTLRLNSWMFIGEQWERVRVSLPILLSSWSSSILFR